MCYSIIMQEVQRIHLHNTICSSRIDHPRIQSMFSVVLLIHNFLILAWESMDLTTGSQDHLIYHLLSFSYGYLLRINHLGLL